LGITVPATTANHENSLPAPNFRRHPVQLLAFGFGSGLAPKAPGTVGTLLAIPLYLLFAQWNLLHYTVLVALAAAAGVWICGAASRQLQVHDHPGIVWDEFVGFWITMWALPPGWIWVLAGFVMFRLYDIVKPWPISVLDRRVGGGLGIMVDDMLAGVMACLTLHAAQCLL
jgi:phosphatidylglycerophosphatase A